MNYKNISYYANKYRFTINIHVVSYLTRNNNNTIV